MPSRLKAAYWHLKERARDLEILLRTRGRPMRAVRTIRYQGQTCLVTCPNWLTRFRADSFATKEPETLDWMDALPSEAVLWDVGANVGLYSLYAALRGLQVVACEPSAFNLELLARNVMLNGLEDRITILPVPLTAWPEPGLFRCSTTEWGGALATFLQHYGQIGPARPAVGAYRTVGLALDDAPAIFRLPPPDYLKIDVDGIEPLILEGARQTLPQVRSVLVEVEPETRSGIGQALSIAGMRRVRRAESPAGVVNEVWSR